MSMSDAINLDADERNADWLRGRTWDLWLREGDAYVLVERMDQLLFVLRAADEPIPVQKGVLRNFLARPAAQAMPEQLRKEVETFVGR